MKKKNDGLEKLKNQLEQFKINLKLATQSEDACEIKYWSKQIKMTEAVLKRVQDIQLKKS